MRGKSLRLVSDLLNDLLSDFGELENSVWPILIKSVPLNLHQTESFFGL